MSNIFNNQNTQEQSWQAIAHQLAYAIKLLEEDASNMKNWHKAFSTLDKYEEKAKDNETIQRNKFGKFTFEPPESGTKSTKRR